MSVAFMVRRDPRSLEPLLACARRRIETLVAQGVEPGPDLLEAMRHAPEFLGIGEVLCLFEAVLGGRMPEAPGLASVVDLCERAPTHLDAFQLRWLRTCCLDLALNGRWEKSEVSWHADLDGTPIETDFSAVRAFVTGRAIAGSDWAQEIDPVRGELPSGSWTEELQGGAWVRRFVDRFGSPFRPAAEKDLFLFSHMNHTGGESFTRAICDALDPQLSLTTPDPKLEPDVTRAFLARLEDRPECRFVADHHLVVPESLAGRSLRRFTIVRHPVTRLLSAYFNFVLKRNMDSPVIPASIREGRGLAFFLDEIADTGRWPGGLEPLAYFNKMTLLSGAQVRIVERDAGFEQIRSSIERRFEFVGVNELYDESLFLVAVMMDLPRLPIWRIYQNTMRPRLNRMRPEIIAKAERLVADDLAIYEWARNRFCSNYGDAINYFRQHIGDLRQPGDSAREGNQRVRDRLAVVFGVPAGEFSDADHGFL
ncbi:MAG: sulfotransferase family 2 domain-containing protein [Rhodocyclaceae bacterium]|nr:sulfotransferase family 2 domain-containing protein [Rhodocyclaceae bacterium]MCL4757163.1 sulfotransferase family 2 domain-containing protein [Rhodocyclaceae bacterium]